MHATLLLLALLAADGGTNSTPPASPLARFRAAQRTFARTFAAGDWDGARAAAEEQRHAAHGRPDADYNLACVEARAGRPDAAFAALGRAVESGMAQDFRPDPDLASLKGDPRWSALEARQEAQRRPVMEGKPELALPAELEIAEDLALDPRTGAVFVSSPRTGEVRRWNGKSWQSWAHPGAEGTSALALGLDPKRRVLQVTTAPLPQARGAVGGTGPPSELVTLALDDARVLGRVAPPGLELRHVLGDLTLGPDGTVYVADSVAGTVYRLPPGGSALQPLFPAGTLGSPQTPVLSAAGDRLYVPDYTLGLFVVPARGGMPVPVSAPPDLMTAGTDGMVAVAGGMVAVQNGIVMPRIVRLWLSPDGTRIERWKVLARGPDIGDPTHATTRRSEVVALVDSGWGRFTDDGKIRPDVAAASPRLIRFALGK